MTCVLDASAAISVILGRSNAVPLADVIKEADSILAPELYISEVVNTFWKYHQFDKLDNDACERGMEKCVALPNEYLPVQDLYQEAFSLACLTRQPVYDMLYLIAARRHHATLLTVDKTMIRTAETFNIKIYK